MDQRSESMAIAKALRVYVFPLIWHQKKKVITQKRHSILSIEIWIKAKPNYDNSI